MMFWDASALLPLCLDEPGTAAVRSLVDKDGFLLVWWASPIECFSAFARIRREGVIDDRGEVQLRRILERMQEVWSEIRPSREVRELAARVLLLHPLRAADALQLAAALVWAEKNPGGHQFVCLDKRLRQAAAREGFVVLPSAEQ